MNNNQLLLTRVNGADATGAGGSLFLAAAPVARSFASVTQLNLTNGAGSVVYEVLAANPGVTDTAQIPIFVVVPPTTCPDSLENSLGATLAPASSVSVATVTDPIPRYIATTPASDCALIGDCAAPYFPVLLIGQTKPPIILNGSSQGSTQTAVITVNNGGGAQMTFNISTTYQTAANLIAGELVNHQLQHRCCRNKQLLFPLTLFSEPGCCPSDPRRVPGDRGAINAGSAGTITLPVTFNVGAPAPQAPTIQGVVNAANSQGECADHRQLFRCNLRAEHWRPKTTPPSGNECDNRWSPSYRRV